MRRYEVEIPSPEYWRKLVKCQDACPVHTDARGYVRAIFEGRFEDAYLIARGPNPLASICGRVCGAPCEAACRRGDLDQSVSIRALKRFVSDKFGGYDTDQRPSDQKSNDSPLNLIKRLFARKSARLESAGGSGGEELTAFEHFLDQQKLADNSQGEKIAIIGSGPAGLATAHDLALMGFRPTVFEMESVPAGMLAVGIPEYRLPRNLITAEVDFIRSLGVEFRCNTKVGEDISLAEIRSEYNATVISVGLKRSRALPIPGADGKNVSGGVEFLRDVALGEKIELIGDIVVIGGGNVAYDIARTVVRQTGIDISRTAIRAADGGTVHLCSLENLEELPADDLEIIEGDEEGVVRHHSLGPTEILLDDNGAVRGVAFQRCLRVFDEEGRFKPQFDETDITTIKAQTVLWGIGQQPDLSFLDSEVDIKRTDRGLIESGTDQFETTVRDVFIAGDIAYGPRLLIDAVASGKKVARKIYESLRGEKLIEKVDLVHLDLPDYSREADYEKLPRTEIPSLAPAKRLDAQSTIVEVGYDDCQAMCEGRRCLDCGVNTIFDSEVCILCGGCADVCPELCLELVSLDRLSGKGELQELLAAQADQEDLSQLSAIVKDETKCIRCALCAERCPTGAITMERMQFTSQWIPQTASS